MLAAVTAVAIAVSIGVYMMRRPTTGATDPAADASGSAQCDAPTAIKIVVTPEVQQAVKTLTQEATAATDTGCVTFRVIDGAPAGVLNAMATGASTAPDVWIPDSSVWLTQAVTKGSALTSVGSFGSSAVVLATTAAAAAEADWTATPPSWPQALTSGRALAVPDLRDHAPSLLALSAARDTAAADPAAVRRLTVATSLGQQRGRVLSPAQGLATLAPSDPAAPLVITGSAAVGQSTGEDSGLVAITPTGQAPLLDYPVVVLARERPMAVQAGVDAFTRLLLSSEGQAAAATLGLDPPEPTAAAMTREKLTFLLTELAILSRPSQILVVVDVSTSMLAEAGPGVSRVDIAGQALGGALPLFPDATRIGMWVFASQLDGGLDYRVVAPPHRLDSPAGDTTQRALLTDAVSSLPDSLVPGGTSLYDVTVAAMLSAQQSWDPDAVTTVVVITDGKNEDSTGYTLEQLTAELQATADPQRPVGLVAVAFGQEADLASLQTIVAAADGWGPSQAVDAREPSALAALLVASLGARIDAAAGE